MATVSVLRTGSTRWLSPGFEQGICSITVVRGAGTRTVVDTGSPPHRPVIEAALAAEGLRPDQIDFVVCTHGHADHIGNNNLFPMATIVVSQHVTKGDLFLVHDWLKPLRLDEDVWVEPAPGHTVHHNAVYAQTDQGLVVVAGDTFLWETDELDGDDWIKESELPEQHRETRRQIRERAGWIVPGHGPMFRVR